MSFSPASPKRSRDLATRHRLILMTKGNHAEQADKLAPLRPRDRTSPPSKSSPKKIRPPTARSSRATSSRPHTSWMIGNSPKSDINPALAAGLHAVFLFHKDTWVLEHAEVDAAPEGQHLIELDAFAKLTDIF